LHIFAARKAQCWRFRNNAATLEQRNATMTWRDGMQIQRDVAQPGTTWSVVYALPMPELYFSVYQQWETIYQLVLA
jgi:hypothetical protein